MKNCKKNNGDNFTGQIDLLELVKLKELDCFFFAEKRNGHCADVTVKSYNRIKLEEKVHLIDSEELELMLNMCQSDRQVYREKSIKREAEMRGEKPCYKVIHGDDWRKLRNSDLKDCFAYHFNHGSINIVYLQEFEERVRAVIYAKSEVVEKKVEENTSTDEVKKSNGLWCG